MTAPALLMRNTTDDPTWTAFIYHDHVSWFPGGGLRGRKAVPRAFRRDVSRVDVGHVPRHRQSRDLLHRHLADEAGGAGSQERWTPSPRRRPTVGASSIKAVNYSGSANTLLVHLQGSRVPAAATVTVYTITAGLHDAASLEQPDRIKPRRADARISPRPDDRSRAVYGGGRGDRGQIAMTAFEMPARRRCPIRFAASCRSRRRRSPSSGDVDLDGQRRVLDCMIDQGVDANLHPRELSRSSSCSPTTSATTLLELCLTHVAGRVPVIVTCSHFSTRIAAERGRRAAAPAPRC